ncbi:hypothetical protein Tco_1427177, partial [Tanacetum coccineum]
EIRCMRLAENENWIVTITRGCFSMVYRRRPPQDPHACFVFEILLLILHATELKPVVVKLATSYFAFKKDERRKVHATDGIKFVEDASKNNIGYYIYGLDMNNLIVLKQEMQDLWL